MEETSEQVDKVSAEKKLLSALNSLPPAPDISKHINARNGKILSFLLVLGFVIYHAVLLATIGEVTQFTLITSINIH